MHPDPDRFFTMPMRTTWRRVAPMLLLAALACGARSAPEPVEDVPFVVTPDAVTLAMLRLARVGARDHVVDLGSGDGRIVITAARRFGASGLGVEIVPDLVQRSRDAAQRAGVADRVHFVEQDLFDTDLSGASVVTMYLLPEVNLRLRPKLLALPPGTRIVSHDWDMGDWAADRIRIVEAPDKPIGREKISRVHLWQVPARLQGLWCAPGGAALRLQQRYQVLEGRASQGAQSWALSGRIDGIRWRAWATGGAALAARSGGEDRFTLHAAQGPWKRWQGLRFTRAAAAPDAGGDDAAACGEAAAAGVRPSAARSP